MNKIFTLLIVTFFSSCVSVQKYNAHIDKKIDVDKLQQDVDYTKEKLLTKHVDIDLYHSKQIIANRLDSFKNSIHQPMLPNDFSRELSKIISSLGHGHTVVSSLYKRMTKEEKKKYKNSKGPISLLTLKSLDNHLYLDKNKSKDSTLVPYTEILSINGIKYHDFYDLYKNYTKGDGYITTLTKYMYGNSFTRYITREIGIQDSLIITFQKNDSIYTKIVKREYLKKNEKSLTKNIIDTIPKKSNIEKTISLTKEDKLKKKELHRHKKKVKKYFAYSILNNEYLRELSFPDKNDSTTAILRIKTFSLGNSNKAYPFIFDSIKKLNVKNLILDVRNNGGGFVRDANYLYSFLTTCNQSQAVMADKMKVNSKFSLMKNNFQNFGIIGNTLGLPLAIYTYSTSVLETQKGDDGNYYYKVARKKDLLNQSNKYQGNLYILINGMSYSATSILSAALQNEGKAIFIGEETGGDYNGTVAGSFNDFKLQNSKLKIFYGLMDFKPNTSRALIGRGVIPDVPIKMSFEDLINKKDPQLDWVLNDIKAKQ